MFATLRLRFTSSSEMLNSVSVLRNVESLRGLCGQVQDFDSDVTLVLVI